MSTMESDSGPSSFAATASSSSPRQPVTTVRPTALHPLPEDRLVLQDTRSSHDSTTPAGGSSNASGSKDGQRQLPKRAPDEHAQAARDKLDRIAKAQQTRQNWAKSTGITLVSKAFGRNKQRQRRRRHGLSSDEESGDDTYKEIEEGRDNTGEVKLMITGNPVVTRVVGAASRAKGRFRGHPESPDASPRIEEAPSRFSISRPGSSLARRFRAPSAEPPADVGLKNVSSSPTAELPSRASIDNHYAPDRPKSRIRPNTGPELLVVDEEGQSHDVAEESARSSAGRLAIPFARSLNNPSPHSNVSTPPSSSTHIPGLAVDSSKQYGDSSSSITGGPMHDEPEAHDDNQPLGVPSPASVSSASSASSDDELDDSALASNSDDEEGDNMLHLNSLSLEHGETITKEELKRRKKLIRREIRRRKANGEPIDDLIHLHGKFGQLGHKVSTRVSKGIHYATNQSRNRRAMDRYSPHPGQLSLQTSDLPRSTSAQSAGGMTPFSTITPSMSRNSNHFGQRRESVATIASSRRSSMTIDDDDEAIQDGDGGSLYRKTSVIDRSILSSRNSIRKYLHAPNVIKRRRQRRWEAEMAAIERAADEEARHADPDAELDSMLAKHAQQEAPSDAHRVKYEFDVLYENQRGLLVFGIPKFSPRTLFQWDPSPWTSSSGKRSAYNIANAQLPDPSWEWAYSEWYIDMTGDVDEAGWQYSGNFGRRFWPNVHFPHGRVGMPKTGADGIREMNARLAEKEKKRQEKESTKEDGGFEAIRRSARARSSKWTGSPDAWTFVRRRRWIRLRRRRPLTGPAKPSEALATPGTAASPGQELTAPDAADRSSQPLVKSGVKLGQSDEEPQGESSLADSDESDSSSSEDDPMLYTPANGRPSAFLPRRLPGHMANGSHPARSKDPRIRRKARKHAREFTGTIRELKSLLPSIIAMDREAKMSRAPTGLSAGQTSYKWAMLKINKVDARNPFISWHFVKHRLQDEDMAFAATTLRTLERKFQQRQLAAVHRKGGATPNSHGANAHPPIPSSFAGASKSLRFDGLMPASESAEGLVRQDGTMKGTSSSRLLEPFAQSPAEGHELTREALVEINFARVLRVLRACKVDRQRMHLWRLWLGVTSLDQLMETARREDLAALGLLTAQTDFGADPSVPARPASPAVEIPHMSGGSSFRYRQRAERVRAKWRASVPTPDASDVWDVLERKLDEVLLLFEFQSNRAALIRLLLAVHEKLHPDHIYRDHSLRAYPIELSPAHIHGDAAEMGGGAGGAFGSRLGGWKRAGLPRLEFYSDLQRILAATPGNEAATNSEYILSRPQDLHELDEVAMPLGLHSSALVDMLEAEAVSDSFLEHEKIPSGSHGGDTEKEAEGLQVDASRLSVTFPPQRGSRSPSPRAPAVPLPYRKSGLSEVSAGERARTAVDGASRWRDSIEPAPASIAAAETAADSMEASKRADTRLDAPQSARDSSPAALTVPESLERKSSGQLREEALLSPRSENAADGLDANMQTSPMADAKMTATEDVTTTAFPAPSVPATSVADSMRPPRPPIPTRSGSVSPQTGARETF
ncbi:peroxin Pex23-like-Penicillium chrysogenum [Pseudozyma hubeiensis SY62]|uniref:Peroxin Pex23-like-Penicillium chrysogenum n=1 Tax=Pseudozyma hubeiensis (strain SY62) TaxID=1305764 RepID=R9PGR7_PSEHS|nr:peroxin Pex23-like-Penicillium chrysogenum [Pseudozyma hubeiensis SY62]GAC97285.1 peroxin Pex23-like-Penicillium chrysogenum [Pseudozyma hubeiensis SY62]